MIPTPKPSEKPNLLREDSSTTQLSIKKIQFKSQLTALYMVSKTYRVQQKPTCHNDHYNSYALKQLAPLEHWTASTQIIFSLQKNFQRPSILELHTDHTIPNFESANIKRVNH